jgi:hypothetical protein
MHNYRDENITEKDITEIFEKICKGDKQGISYDNFKKYSL